MTDKYEGVLRISYSDRKTVFEYRLRKQDVEEMIAYHMKHWSVESKTNPETGAQAVFTIDQSKLIADWVENIGTEKEKVTRIKESA